MKKLINLIAACVVSALTTLGLAYALNPIIPTIPFTFTNGTVANATQVNSNFQTIQANVNAFQSAGSWTCTDQSGAGLSFTSCSAGFTQIGNMVFAYASVGYPGTANTAAASFGNLPVNFTTQIGGSYSGCFMTFVPLTGPVYVVPVNGANTVSFKTPSSTMRNVDLSNTTIAFECIYPAS